MPKTLSPGLPTNRDRWGSTWPLRLARAGGPFVPVGSTNRDQNASTRQQFRVWGFFLEGGWGFCRVNLGVSYIVANRERCPLLSPCLVDATYYMYREDSTC